MSKKLFAGGKKERSARQRQGALGLKPQHSLERVNSVAEKGREMHEWCRVKKAQAPGRSAGKLGGGCICTEALILTNYRARQTSARC